MVSKNLSKQKLLLNPNPQKLKNLKSCFGLGDPKNSKIRDKSQSKLGVSSRDLIWDASILSELAKG